MTPGTAAAKIKETIMFLKKEGRGISSAVKMRTATVLSLFLVCTFALVAVAKSSYTVNVMADGKTSVVKTDEKEADTILTAQGIQVGRNDKVDTEDFVVGGDAREGNAIRVYRAVTVTVVDGDIKKTLTTAGKVQDALDASGIDPVREDDALNYSADTELKDGMKIIVSRAYTVTIKADGASKDVKFANGTILDLLKKAGIKIGPDDVVKPSVKTAAKAGQTVTVKRVTYKNRTATKTIKYKTVYVDNDEWVKTKQKTLQEGEDGTKVVVYRDKYVDGVKKSSKKVVETVIKAAKDARVERGTKTVESAATLTNGTSDVSNALAVITGSATAYTADPGARCSTGVVARRGYVAVNPNQIPYGTKMYIVATDGTVYGNAIAADTGGFATAGTAVVDLYMDTYQECVNWGRRNVNIYILSWGDGHVYA